MNKNNHEFSALNDFAKTVQSDMPALMKQLEKTKHELYKISERNIVSEKKMKWKDINFTGQLMSDSKIIFKFATQADAESFFKQKK